MSDDPEPTTVAGDGRGRSAPNLAIGAGLLLITFVVFWPVLDHDFINYDDDGYVTQNPYVRGGLTAESVSWAWTARRASNWHPLTWLSHMLDCQVYALDPSGHHLTSLLLHALNALLFFLVLQRMTAALWRSAIVAALFAIHPLHVESVAWVAERKDVLSTFFLMLTLAAYVRYVAAPTLSRYAPVFLFLALGLMAKPMLVTLPFLLLLLDFWPLGRLEAGSRSKLVAEKIPLFILAAASSVVTFAVQQTGKVVGTFEQYPLGARLSNAVVSYVDYVWKMVWPRGLAIFYPHPGPSLPWWRVGVAAGLLLLVSGLAWRARRTRPYLLCGWLWFLGTLVPVIGIVQVGEQAMADRYTYVPLIGLFVAAVWGLNDLVAGPVRRFVEPAGIVLAGALILALMVAARSQVGHWRDSESLFRHALAVTEENHTAHINLALVFADRDRLDDVIDHLTEAVRIKPDHPKAQHNLGVALSRRGRHDEAHEHLLRAVELEPAHAEAHYNLGISFERKGKTDDAIRSFLGAVEVDPTHAPAHYRSGALLAKQERWDQAIEHLSRAVALQPRNAQAHYNLGAAFYYTGWYAEAWKEVRLAERLGFRPSSRMIEELKKKMPEPR